MTSGSVVALAGGVGGARLADGIVRVWSAGRTTVVVNTGDDFDHLGLRICPDIDTVTYTLAGIGDARQGWGVDAESFAFMRAAKRLGAPDWFSLGDQDLATHVLRSHALRQGEPLSDVTARFARELGVDAAIVPMSDTPVATMVDTDEGLLSFQDYFVRLRCAPVVKALRFAGAEAAQPSASVITALEANDLEAIVFCPSNPFVSIAPILAIEAIKRAVLAAGKPRVAVSPIVGGAAIKGPAAKMMAEFGMECSALGVARHYVGMIDALVIDRADEPLAGPIAALGIEPVVTGTVMRCVDDRVALAGAIQTWLAARR